MAYTLLEISYTIVTIFFTVYTLHYTKKITSKKGFFLLWGAFGVVFNLYSFSWLYTVYPLVWMPEGVAQLGGIFLLHSIVSLVAGSAFALVAIFFLYIKKIPEMLHPVFFASALTVSEVLRSLFLSILFKGEGTSIGLHFTAGTLGNALSSTPLIQYAYFGGVFGLTFIFGSVVYIFYSFKKISLYVPHVVLLCVGLLYISNVTPTTIPKNTTFGVVTTDFGTPKKGESDTFFKNVSRTTHTLTSSLVKKEASPPEIILYPEDTRFLSLLAEKDKKEVFSYASNTLFIDGDTVYLENGKATVSAFYHTEQDKPKVRGKEFLLPFNEYTPYLFEHLALLFITKEHIEEYKKYHTYTPVYSSKTVTYKNLRIATLICSEILSHSTITSLKKENPDVVIFQSRLGVFHNNPWFIMHLYSFTKVAAATLRTQILSVTDSSPSLIVSPKGKVLKTLPKGNTTSVLHF
jgi:apolipoprotein N-acyltransferase